MQNKNVFFVFIPEVHPIFDRKVKEVKTERNAKQKCFFVFIPEVHPIFDRKVKEVKTERNAKQKCFFVFIPEVHPPKNAIFALNWKHER